MKHLKPVVANQYEAPHGDIRSYTTAFITCLAITGLAYAAAVSDKLSDHTAIALIAGLAAVQCVIQLRRFLHLGTEFKPRWKLLVFCFMLTVVVIFVTGSLWIMSNLNYRMMRSPVLQNKYVQSQDGL